MSSPSRFPVKGGQELNVTMQDVQKALDKLAPEHREILLMIGITELSYEEAAQVCNIAVGTVKSRLNRARAKLAEHLGLSGVHEIDYDPTVTGLAARKSTKASETKSKNSVTALREPSEGLAGSGETRGIASDSARTPCRRPERAGGATR